MNVPQPISRRLGRVASPLIFVAVLAAAAFLGQRASMTYLMLIVGGLGLLFLLWRPGLGLVAMATLSFTLPLSFGTGSEVELTAPVFLIPAVAGVWLLDGLRRRELRLPRSGVVLPLLLFLGSGLLSLLAGNSYWDPLIPRPGNLLPIQLAQWAVYALSALIFLVAADLGSRERWLRYATFAFLIVATIVVLEFYVPPLARLFGWSAARQANRAMFWTILGGLTSGQLFFNPRLSRPVRIWLGALLVAAGYIVWIKLNVWVSGWMPFTTAVAAVIWFWFWRRNRPLGLVVVLLLILLVVILFPWLLSHAGGETELDMSWGGRLVLYRATLDIVKEHPILGLGPASYRHYGKTRWLSTGFGHALYLQPLVSSHNNYLDVYAQQGLVGVALFLWLLFALGRVGWKLLRRYEGDFEAGYVHGALGGFVGALVAMLLADWFLPFVYNIGFPGFRTSAVAWMFLGGLVALEQRSRGREEAAGKSDGASGGVGA
jgi:O-antigen ligase